MGNFIWALLFFIAALVGSFSQDMPSEFYAGAILFFAVFWAVGLLPPVLIRFAFARKQLARGAAFGLAILFFFLNVCILAMLRSQNLTSGRGADFWLVCLTFCTYNILRMRRKGFADNPVPATMGVNPLVENVSVKPDDGILNNGRRENIAMVNLSDKSDENYFEIAAQEFDSGQISKGLTLKVEVAAGGDAVKARLLYIQTRALELANEEKDLAGLREALAGAVKDSNTEDTFLKRIGKFRVDYPNNVKIDELKAEFEYQQLNARIQAVGSYDSEGLEKRCQMYESFLANHPAHLKRHEIEKNKSKSQYELANFRDQTAFSALQRGAQELISQHEYQEASDLYRKYLDQYHIHADEALKMIDETIPKLINAEPARKRRVKRNFIVGALIVAVIFVIFGFFAVKDDQKFKHRFTVLDHGTSRTVVDNLTGLEWVQAPYSIRGNSTGMDWNSAIDVCTKLVYAGHSDWRLPSTNELMGLVNCGVLSTGHLFSAGMPRRYYWSGICSADVGGFAWYVDMDDGYISYINKTFRGYVWPVRGGQ